ncbi:MAG: tRNA (guanosine(37)-N1)-methyltransferase TrmD [Firmicutes bacterium]|nr:tRNA (guanosine(37)-N1)-methyltransferase TrmD [Bacillota bacterium]
MRVDILTIFPEMFQGPFGASIIKRAQDKGLLKVNLINIRNFSQDRHGTVDDYPFGGGSGMVMKPEPIFAAVESVLDPQRPRPHIVLMSPQGILFNQAKAAGLAKLTHLIIICGHYEGIDERVREELVDEDISIGDYVLTGGELPAMVVVDAVARLIPGVLGKVESAWQDSFSDGLLEYPQYTRPREFRGLSVPDVLLSGNHEQIRRWRREQSLRRTWLRRPDLLARALLTPEDQQILERIKQGSPGQEGINRHNRPDAW